MLDKKENRQTKTMIELKDVTKYYDNFLALNNISFSVSLGEIVGLLGPNGAGKTTTLRLITGYLTPSSGSIKIMDLKYPTNSIQIKKIIGYLPESVPIYKNLLVYEYLNYVGSIRGIEPNKLKQKIKEISHQCQIKDIMGKEIGELSKGLTQRVGIASVLLHDPEILILDEPTSGLDPNQILEIRDLIKEIGKHKTVILSSHILSEVEATCGRVIIINKGKIVADDSKERLKEIYMGKILLTLGLKNADFNDVKKELSKIEEIEKIELIDFEESNSFYIELILSEDVREKIYSVIKNTPWSLIEFSRKKTSLEEIFKEVTMEQ